MKSRNLSYSSVSIVNDGTTYWRPQSTRMCSSGVSKQDSMGGRSVRGRGAGRFKHNLCEVQDLSSKSKKSVSKAEIEGSYGCDTDSLARVPCGDDQGYGGVGRVGEVGTGPGAYVVGLGDAP